MNKKLILNALASLVMLLMLSNNGLVAQNIAINTTGAAANASSMLDISAGTGNNRGLLIPRVTTAQKTAMNPLPAVAQGLIIYQTDGIEGFYYNTSTTTVPVWSYLTPGGWSLTGNAGTVAATNFIGTTDAIDWVVRTNNTERMRVLSGGNIGIATATPQYTFTIASGATFGFGDGTATYSSRTESRADAGLQGSSGAQSGFFQTSAPAPAANWPAGAASWWHLLDVRHSNDANNYAMQFSGSFFDQRLYFRKTNGAANTAWSEVLTSSATIGQSSTSYFSNAAVTLNSAALVYASGYPVNITVPDGYTVILSGDIGIQTTSAAGAGYSLVDVVLVIDGAIPADAGYQRITAQNNAGITGVFEYASFSQAFTLTAGVHTVGIAGSRSGGSNATFGGNNASVLQGELTVTMIKN